MFCGHDKEDSSHPKIYLAPSAGNAASTLAAKDLDLIPSELNWAEGGRAIYFETGVKVDPIMTKSKPNTDKRNCVIGV